MNAADSRDAELRTLKEIARWTRELAWPSFRTRVQGLLDTDSKKRAYAAMDGATGVMAIERATGANHNDIGQWVKQWVVEGMVDPDSNPPRTTFKLAELGIDTPPPKTTRARKS